jgi:hypothetical protein
MEQDRDTFTALHFFLKDRLKSGKWPLIDFDRIARLYRYEFDLGYAPWAALS